jgi:hypothetical protein
MDDRNLNSTYLDRYERRAEYARIVDTVIKGRQNMLVYGEARVGKTRLLRKFAETEPMAAYVSLAASVRDVLASLLSSTAENTKLKTMAHNGLSAGAMRGLLDERLAHKGWILVLDHVNNPSANVSSLIRELHYYGRNPILFAGRSVHMEDIGKFRSFCYEKSSRLELKPWSAAAALEFARHEAAALQLSAVNLDETVKGISMLSAGYPGRIVDMLQMAASGKYAPEGNIKFNTLYLDYIMHGY